MTNDVELLFQKVVRLDFARISTRLRLAKKYRIEASPIMQIHNVFLHSPKRKSNCAKAEEFRCQLTRIITFYRNLKSKPTPQRNPSALYDMEQIIKAIHRLSRCSEFFPTLQSLSKMEALQMETLKDLVDKIGHYYQACIELVSAARRKRNRMFRRIDVEDFEIRVPSCIRAPSARDSALSLIKTLRASSDTSKVLQRFQNSESEAAAALARRVNATRSAIKVHAEIKLLFYYEVHPQCVTPRVICANKSACYLCDLFLKIHGRFQVPMTFGKLNERWILPDWLDNVRADRLPALQTAIKQFDDVLDVQIKRLLTGVKRMPDPKESAIGLSAHWSASSIEDSSQAALLVGRVRTQSIIKCSEAHALYTHPPGSEQQAEMGCKCPKRLEVEPATALDHLSGLQMGPFIRGHKSRSYEILSACGTAQLGGSIRRIDFHDLELFLETVYAAGGRLIALRCSEPPDLPAESFVDISKMNRGEELILKFTETPEGENQVYVKGKGRAGISSWWKICWKRGLALTYSNYFPSGIFTRYHN